MQKYLPLFLEWLPKQTFFDKMEVILDHNEPTADEVAQVKAFQKKYPGRIKHIIVDKVDPIGTSMNRCIREAQGQFVTIWNVDDLRADDSIEKQAKVLLDNPQVSIVYGDFTIVRKFGTTKGKYVSFANLAQAELTRGMYLGPFYMFRKSLVEKAGYFDEQLKSGADFDLALRLCFNATAAPVLDNLGFYLDEGRGASTRPDSKQPLELNVICLRYGIFDRLMPDHIALVGQYDIPHLIMLGKSHSVTEYVPNYKLLIEQRYKQHFFTGARKRKLETIAKLRGFKHSMLRWYHGSDE